MLLSTTHYKTDKRWTQIGAAFPHKEGLGYSISVVGIGAA
jgi:hypothetical protein